MDSLSRLYELYDDQIESKEETDKKETTAITTNEALKGSVSSASVLDRPKEIDGVVDTVWQGNSAFLSNYPLSLTEKVLSERLKLFSGQTMILPIVYPPKVKKGILGVYRRALRRTSLHNFGYVEETRIVTRLSTYNSHLLLHLNPVVSLIEGKDQACYLLNNEIRLVLYDECKPTWLLLSRGHHPVRGVDFEPCFRPVKRTVVEDGSFVEINGLVAARSARGIIPARFTQLFADAMEDDGVVMW